MVWLADESFYEECRRRVVDVFSGVEGVLAICEFGSVEAIGHSDIDLVFVVDERAYQPLTIPRLLRRAFSLRERFLVHQHPQLILPVGLAERANLIRPLRDPRPLWGTRIEFEPLADPFTTVFILVEILVDSYPRLLEENRGHPRRMLQLINAFRYVLELWQSSVVALGGDSDIEEQTIRDTLETNQSIRVRSPNGNGPLVDGHLARAVSVLNESAATMKAGVAHALPGLAELSPDVPQGELRKGDIVFTDAVPPNTTKTVVRLFGKSASFYANPRALGLLFEDPSRLGGELGRRVRARVELLDAYKAFNDRYCGGVNIYRPFWHGPRRPSDRLRHLACEVAAISMGGTVWNE